MFRNSETIEAIRQLGFWRVAWYRTGYRRFMKLAHKFNWHHTVTCGPFEDGSTMVWCQWCGIRHVTPRLDYAKQITAGKTQRCRSEYRIE